MAKVFIPAGVRDKATRDTLIAVVRELERAGGGLTVKASDPDEYTPGAVGSLIYSEASDSIWTFDQSRNWVLVAGVSTRQVAEGYTGTSTFTGLLFYSDVQTANPGAPSAATWSLANDTFASITPANKWSTTQPAVNVTDSTVREWTTEYNVTINPDTTPISVSILFSTPTGAIQITDNLESDNYVAGSAGWAIRRDTGFAEFGTAAIRGQLTAGSIATGAITSGKIDVGTLSAITANMGAITAGSISSSSGNMVLDLSAGTLIVRDASNNIRVKIGVL